MANGLKGLLSQAERVARKRAQPLTTAHVLLALYQRSPAGALLDEHGVSEAELIEWLSSQVEEHANVLPIAIERAEKTAAALRQGRAGAMHVLLALTREPRSVAYRCLERAGVAPAALHGAALARLDAPRAEARKSGNTGKSGTASVAARSERTVLQGSLRISSRPRRALLSLGAQQRLAAETERRRSQDRAQRKLAPSPTRDEQDQEHDQQQEQQTAATAAETPALRKREQPAEIARAAPARLASSDADPFALDPERFPLLATLGRNLCSAARAGEIDAVLGRDDEIEQVLDVLSRRRSNNPVLVGPPGVGKTAVALGVALELARGTAADSGRRVLVELSAASLVSGTGVRGALSERLQAIVQEVARARGRVLLFIDEIHGLIGSDDGADSISAGLKTALARGELPCIGATTEAEYRRIFERDAALARRFTRVEVTEPAPDAALAIIAGIAPDYERHHGVAYTADALRTAVEMSARFISERHLPDKAIALLDQAGARVRRRGGGAVDVRAVAEVVSEHASVPLERLLMRDADALLALEAHLEARVVGQRGPIAAIADALRKSAAGFRGARPLGTFLFLGPTGVGKTEMAKAISELLFPGCEMTRVDMSELSEPHGVSRLLGAPPGYIGHEDGGQLTEPVRRRPYQLVLLDEVEKAHRDVLLALLPLLDEGRLTDGRGRTVDFKNTVIVMTSNLGVDSGEPRARVGFGASTEAPASSSEALGRKQRALAAARQALPPELWNRIDEPLYFDALDRAAAAQIAERMTRAVAALMAREHGVRLSFEPSAFEALIAAGGHDPALGARPMRRAVARLIEAKLAKAILGGEIRRGEPVIARGSGDQIVFERTVEIAPAAE